MLISEYVLAHACEAWPSDGGLMANDLINSVGNDGERACLEFTCSRVGLYRYPKINTYAAVVTSSK